ncbi:MAG: hypothetical protein ACI4JN_01940 [Ruminococcus sp.]
MIKALLKKQLMESFSWLYFNRKNGKKRDAKGIAVYSLMYAFIFGILGYIFFQMSLILCEPLCGAGYGWLYFSIVSLVAVFLGVFGSVFNTFSSLYQAKDNDMLLAMPIKPYRILIMRLSGVYLMGLMYELMAMIPALIVWFMYGKVSIAGMIFSVILPFVLSLFILTLSCILGWVVAAVSSKVKNKSFITVILSLGFIAAYYYLYSQAYKMLSNIVANAEDVASGMKKFMYPFYHMGLAAQGNPLSMLIFTGIIAALFAVVYIILEHGFLKLATTNKGTKKVRYNEKRVKAANASSALLRKELKRFTGSPNYMLNCGLGIVIMLIAAAAILIKGGTLAEMLPKLYEGAETIIPLIIAAALCMMTSMNDMTAPSVSLEGKNLWLVQVLPVTPWEVLKAKLKLHLLLTLPPAIVLTICTLVVFRPSVEFMFLIPAAVGAFIVTMALFGLFMNLKFPNLNWTNEIVPIKQSMSVAAALFGGWAVVIGLAVLYFLLRNIFSPAAYLGAASALLIVLSVLLFVWIKNKGSKIFAEL